MKASVSAVVLLGLLCTVRAGEGQTPPCAPAERRRIIRSFWAQRALSALASPIFRPVAVAAATHFASNHLPPLPSLRAASERMGIWVPLYVGPSPEYDKLIKSVETDKCIADSFHGTVLTGPRSGPPSPKDPAEDAQFRKAFSLVANSNQWTAFGYVTTNYMKRPLAEVLADVDTWLTAGAGGYGDMVQGVWIDNAVSNFDTEAAKAYYGAVVERVKAYGKLAALNPGANVRSCDALAAMKADFVNNFEDTYKVWATTGDAKDRRYDCPCKDQTRCIASIHSYPDGASAAEVGQTMRLMAARGYDAVFLTDRVMPDHYSALPKLWPAVVDAACATVLGKTTTVGRRMLGVGRV